MGHLRLDPAPLPRLLLPASESYSGACRPPLHSANRRGAGCDLGPQLRTLLGHRTLDGGSLHLAFVVDNHASVVLEVNEDPLAAAPSLLLPDHHTLQHLFPQLRLAFLARAKHHVAGTTLRDLIQTTTDATDSHNVEVLGAAVVRTVHQSGDTATQGHLQFAAASATTSALH